MSLTARTPPLCRLTAARPSAPPLSQTRHTREIDHNSRPHTPAFLDPNISGVFSTFVTNSTPHPTGSASRVGGARPSTSALAQPSGLRKRPVDVLDLTQTDDRSSSAQTKRTKLEPLILERAEPLAPPRRKPVAPSATTLEAKDRDRRERQDAHDRMTEEAAQWRAKYKRAFPTFVFYFDQLDPASESALGKQVRMLGAVSRASLLATRCQPSDARVTSC